MDAVVREAEGCAGLGVTIRFRNKEFSEAEAILYGLELVIDADFTLLMILSSF